MPSPGAGSAAAPTIQASSAPVLEETTILATGIFHGGTPALIIGLPYAIGTHGDRVVVTGPLTTTPGEVHVDQPRATADISLTGDQAMLTAGERRRGQPEVALSFGRLAVGRGIDLEARIRPAAEPAEPLEPRPTSRLPWGGGGP